MNYLNELNEEQRLAVEHINGPVMVLAGAGSGKTRVLSYRIAHLLNNDIDAFNILSLTFTNKSAKEMKERIAKIVGEGEARNLWMGTFHSVFSRILRVESAKIGYPSNFTIYDTDDSRSLIRSIIKELSLDEKVYKPSLVHNRISSSKNTLVDAGTYSNDTNIQSEDRQSSKPMLGEIYKRYERRCFKAAAMDFDDLLFKTCTLLEQFPEVLNKYQNKFRYVLVDEFQDTNFAQYVILKQLSARYENICVVGDDAQSIYAFRGANIQNILNFKIDFPDTVTYKLEQNYRSTKNIVNAANNVISNNKQQLHKTVWTDNEEGQKIKVFRSLTDNEEGLTAAQQIFQFKNSFQLHNKDFAILYRTNAQSRSFEEALRKLNIPYRIYGGFSFYQRKEIKDLLAYFRLTINHNDEEALKRVINYPARGIGDTSIDKLILCANDHGSGLWTVLENIDEFQLAINSGTRNKIRDFVTMIKSFASMVANNNAFDLGSHIAKHSGILKDLYEDKSPEGLGKTENIQELLNGMREFTTPHNPPEGGTFSAQAEGRVQQNYGYETADPIMYGLLKDFVKKHRSNPTQAEQIFWELVGGKKLEGFKFRRQHIIGQFIADFVCLANKLIVEIDGLMHQLPENILGDEQRTQWLGEHGFTVIRFSNDEVIGNPDGVMEKVKEKLQTGEFENFPLEDKEVSLPEFMQEIALFTDSDEDKEEKDTVSLMTIHAAKGLEFPVVFIVGLEENLFPSQMAMNERSGLEEERRLFYVALTRAQKQAVLSYAVSRYKWGNRYDCEPSRFITELDEKFLDFQRTVSLKPQAGAQRGGWGGYQKYNTNGNGNGGNGQYSKPKSNGVIPPEPKTPSIDGKKLIKIKPQQNYAGNFSTASELQIQVGMEVKHQRFGVGKVIHMEGGYPNQKATVFFPEAGQKQLLLKFAKLEVIK